jgi:hypothetical protein
MNVGLHGIAKGGINHAMPLQKSFVREGSGYYEHGEMASPAPRPPMADMLMALVDDLEYLWNKGGG